ncbi:MAG: tRNA uridine-5-carboxymethylaminomethyl(34) synthesis GTPase MnmE, partial [Armatimonadota bacterium]|nr:tRNA uridine-5-carboxymethylaminomethyl(34) synthesis GTPase MnmE [Armatimonadota bacterium]
MDSAADTIAAIATAPGPSALAVVRMSGSQALSIGQQFLMGMGGIKSPVLHPRRTYLCEVLDSDGLAVDQAIVTFYRGPASYTGEDVLELTVHGGAMASRVTLDQCLRHGARAALPGEFTLRAFLAGRLDLSQAEAVIDTVEAQTQAGLRLAHRQLTGGLSSRVEGIRRTALGALAQVEAAVDFPDDVDEPDRTALAGELENAARVAHQLALEARAGKIYRDGIRLAIIGRPNVGKSSLLNALLREDRAIVTPIPGTTRDVIEETMSLGGVPIRVLDTAGIHPTDDPVERLGVERALRSAHSADLCLLVLDRSEPLQEDDWGALEQTSGIRTVIILNKCDLAAAWKGECIDNEIVLDGRTA